VSERNLEVCASLGALSAEEVALIRRNAEPTSRPALGALASGSVGTPWIPAAHKLLRRLQLHLHQPDRLGSLRLMMDLANDMGCGTGAIIEAALN